MSLAAGAYDCMVLIDVVDPWWYQLKPIWKYAPGWSGSLKVTPKLLHMSV